MSHVEAYSGRQYDYPSLVKRKPMTANKGASETRHEIIRKMNELERGYKSYMTMWTLLRTYVKGMARRASVKKGGLGRK